MKTEKTLRLVGALAIAAGALVGCGGGSTVTAPEAGFAGIFNLKSNAVTINFVDAATGKILTQSAKVSFTGALVGDLSDASGAAITSQTVRNGVANVYTNQTGILGINVTASGYLPGSMTLDVYGNVAYGVVRMVKLSAAPTGVTVATGTATITGNLTDSANVIAGKSYFKPALASVFTLATGEQATGALKFTLVNYDITKAQSSVPGGLYVLSNGSFNPVFFAGAATLQMGATNGGPIVSVSPAAKLRIPVAGTNPATNKPYAAGDVVSVVSLAEGASNWSDAGTAVVAQDADGLYALVSVSTPGSWGVGFIQNASCTQGVTFNFPKLGGLNLDVTLARTGWSQTFPTAGRTSVRIPGIPVGRSVSFNVAFQGQTISYSSSRTFSCGETVAISDTIDASSSKAAFKLNAVCQDGTPATDKLGNFPLVLFDAGMLSGAGYSGTDGGISILGLSTGVKYKYVIPLQPLGDLTGSLVADGGAIEVRLPCTALTGATGASGD